MALFGSGSKDSYISQLRIYYAIAANSSKVSVACDNPRLILTHIMTVNKSTQICFIASVFCGQAEAAPLSRTVLSHGGGKIRHMMALEVSAWSCTCPSPVLFYLYCLFYLYLYCVSQADHIVKPDVCGDNYVPLTRRDTRKELLWGSTYFLINNKVNCGYIFPIFNYTNNENHHR